MMSPVISTGSTIDPVSELTSAWSPAASSLSDLSNRREQGGKASADFLDFEAHSGSMQRKSREI
jgi:hypothetical protein